MDAIGGEPDGSERITRHSETSPILALRAGSPVVGKLASLGAASRFTTKTALPTSSLAQGPQDGSRERYAAIKYLWRALR